MPKGISSSKVIGISKDIIIFPKGNVIANLRLFELVRYYTLFAFKASHPFASLE